MQTFARYLAFQLPSWLIIAGASWLLYEWADMSLAWGALVLLLWIAKDLALFPFVRDSYRHDPHRPGEELMGQLAEVVVPLDTRGWVRVGAERWQAAISEEGPSVPIGTRVRICGLRDHTLLVKIDEVKTDAQPPATE